MRKTAGANPSTILMAAAVAVCTACWAQASVGVGRGDPRGDEPRRVYAPIRNLMDRLSQAVRQVRTSPSLRGGWAQMQPRPWVHAGAHHLPDAGVIRLTAVAGCCRGTVAAFAFAYRPSTTAVRAHLRDLPPPASI
jgi:hypothetical protein